MSLSMANDQLFGRPRVSLVIDHHLIATRSSLRPFNCQRMPALSARMTVSGPTGSSLGYPVLIFASALYPVSHRPGELSGVIYDDYYLCIADPV